MLKSLATYLIRITAIALGVVVAVLPARHWVRFDRLPVRAMAGVSVFATAALGAFVWVSNVSAYVHRASDLAAAATLDLAARQVSGAAPQTPLLMSGPQMYTVATLIGFALFTPMGVFATYLLISAALRGATVVVDDAIGDPALTVLDGLGVWIRETRSTRRARRVRERAEGPDVGDRRHTGADAGLPDVDFVIVAPRRKADWSAGTIVIAADDWYRLGEPFDAELPFGLRTVYPLTKIDKTVVLRRYVGYEFPPLQRSPGRLT